MIDENKGTEEAIQLREFEARFGPVIMMLPGRRNRCANQRAYADLLLSTARQHSSFPR